MCALHNLEEKKQGNYLLLVLIRLSSAIQLIEAINTNRQTHKQREWLQGMPNGNIKYALNI